MSTIPAVTQATFASEVLSSPIPVVVDYWADWCAPCKQLSPIVDELAAQFEGLVKFVKVDTNAETQVAATQDIRGLPTVQVFVNGEMVNQIAGSVTKMKLRQAVEEVM